MSVQIDLATAKEFINRYNNSTSRIVKDEGDIPIFGYYFDSNDIRSCIDNTPLDPTSQNDFGLFFGIDDNNHLKLISIKFDISDPSNPIPEISRMFEYSEPRINPYFLS